MTKKEKNLLTVAEFCAKHPWPQSEGMMRYFIFNAQKKGITRLFVRKYNSVLIDEGAFLGWAKKNKKGE